MDSDDIAPPPRRTDALDQLARQDLDPLSVDELDGRIAALKAEIARCEAKRDTAKSFRASADAIFKR